MENLPFRILVFSFLMLLGRTSEAQHTSANEIFGFNQKANAILEKIRNEVVALGEVDGFSEFAKNVSIKDVNGQDSYSRIQHSLTFEVNTRDVTFPVPKEGNLPPLAGYSDVEK